MISSLIMLNNSEYNSRITDDRINYQIFVIIYNILDLKHVV